MLFLVCKINFGCMRANASLRLECEFGGHSNICMFVFTTFWRNSWLITTIFECLQYKDNCLQDISTQYVDKISSLMTELVNLADAQVTLSKKQPLRSPKLSELLRRVREFISFVHSKDFLTHVPKENLDVFLGKFLEWWRTRDGERHKKYIDVVAKEFKMSE